MSTTSTTKQLTLFDELAANPKPKHSVPRQSLAPCIRCTEQYLSDRQVASRYDISKATVWRWHDTNPNFPRRIKLSPGTSRWKLSELVRFEAKKHDAATTIISDKAKGRLG